MTPRDDALWDPALPADAELQQLQDTLACFGARARGLETRLPALPRTRPRAAWLRRVAFAGVAAIVLLQAGHLYRLAWSDGTPWRVRSVDAAGVQALGTLAPERTLTTGAADSADIDVARIGRIALSPQSTLRLLETRSGRHRVELQSGHLRARIWAPPGYFAVTDRQAEVIDLGCDFDLWKRPDGSGRVLVRSGWVAYRVGAEDVLVPAGYAMHFSAEHPATPLRPQAATAFATAVQALDAALLRADAQAADAAAQIAADSAQDADAFTLLSLLSRHPGLAHGALYPRLAQALNATAEPGHRAAWASGETAAVQAWWERLPTQPKRWWTHWRDALG